MTRRDYDFDLEQDRATREDRSGIQWASLDIARSLRQISTDVHAIRVILTSVVHLTLLELHVMPKTITVGQTANAHLVGTGSDGQPFKLGSGDTFTPVAATPADVIFGAPVFNADGSVDIPVTGVNAIAGDDIMVTVDAVTSNKDTLTIMAAAPTLATVTLTLE